VNTVSPIANRESQTGKFVTLIAMTSLVVVCAVMGLLLWSSREVDRIALQHEEAVVATMLTRAKSRVAHMQESSTIWEDAVTKVNERPLDLEWVDRNMGVWFYDYGGIDEVYVLDPQGTPIYAMREGKRTDTATYGQIAAAARPIVTALRKLGPVTQKTPDNGDLIEMSPGLTELAMVRGQPAIISVKPITFDSGAIAPQRGQESVHVSVVYLDADLIASLSAQFGLHGAYYSPSLHTKPGEASVPLRTESHRNIGYLVWRPFAPGRQVTAYVGPTLIIGLLLAIFAIYLLAKRLARRTLDLEDSRTTAQHHALHDGLTGLPNRVMFQDRLDQALSRCRRDGKLVALLYLDLDRFKQVNDSLGHAAGDEVIREVASRLATEIRLYDTVARLGGDEFAILIVAPDDRAALEQICERIIAEISRPFDLPGAQSFIGASIGVAMAPDDGLDRTELARKADIALYRAKIQGGGRSMFFEPWMDEVIRIRETTHRELRIAIADCDKQLKVLYQPVFSTATGAITGVEALLRWDHPVSGIISPAEFIRAAEETGLIEVLGNWVLRRAMLDAANWPELRVAVNVSPIQVHSRNFASGIEALLEETGMEADRLELEITETALMGASAEVSEALARLRGIGVAVALDDFGTGYSSLSHIRDIAVDRIKIDRSFVKAINTPTGIALVEAVVALAKANGLQLTAEGIETERQHTFLKELGCHEVQGFLLSRPVGVGGISAMLGRDPRDRPLGTLSGHRAA
jgi:diguanylate cyclase (GGDEF)-like protein